MGVNSPYGNKKNVHRPVNEIKKKLTRKNGTNVISFIKVNLTTCQFCTFVSPQIWSPSWKKGAQNKSYSLGKHFRAKCIITKINLHKKIPFIYFLACTVYALDVQDVLQSFCTPFCKIKTQFFLCLATYSPHFFTKPERLKKVGLKRIVFSSNNISSD